MNRGYSFTARGQARSPLRRDRLQPKDARGTSSSNKNQAIVKQDFNIDDFGDMGSDEDDFQSLGSHFVPPKPPAKPQYNLVPYGFLRDDDELVEEDYDGVPIDDTTLLDSPKNQPWQSSPQKTQPEEIRGTPISVLGSSNRFDSQLSNWPKNTTRQDSVPRNRPGLGRSSIDSNINKTSDSSQQLGTGRWDKKSDPVSKTNLGNYRNIPSLLDGNIGKPKSFVRPQNDPNPFIQPGSKQQTSHPNSVRGNDDFNSLLKTSSKPVGNNTSFVWSTDDNNPFLKMGDKQLSSDNAVSSVSAKHSTNVLPQFRDNSHLWNDKPKPAQGSTPAWTEKGRESSQRLKAHVQPSQNQIFTPAATVANTSAQLELLQAAAIQQALTGLTQLSSQSGLNLLGAQNLLVQATQNPTLAAALVSTGIRSIQPNTLNNPAVESLLKSPVTTAPDVTRCSSGLLTYPLRANTTGNSGSTSRKKSIPDGSGATRYPAPDVSSLVFDPSTGYRFDASTGLHYDANSGYFFNSELKVFLRWDKFTQTYLKVDNPPGVPRSNNSSTDRMSYIAGSSITPQDKGQLSSSFLKTSFSKESYHSLAPSIKVPSVSGLASLMNVPTSRGLPPLMNALTSSAEKDKSSVLSSISTVPTEFSKPPPPLPQSLSDSRFQPIGTNLSSVAEQKAAALPNFAETSLFNKLRKAKLAQTAQTKSDRQRWGSPDPLLEAAQKHAAETDNSLGGILNMKEILQRSRQFMKQKTGNGDGESVDLQMQKGSSRSQSGEWRKIRSRSRSLGRPFRHSRSPEIPGNRRGRSSISPQQSRKPNSRGRSPTVRGRGKPSLSPARKRSFSRSRSPNNRGRGKASLSPEARRRRSASRGRSPTNRGRGPSPEVRKRRRASKGRSPLGRKGKTSKSPVPRHRRPISKGRSPERRLRGRPSISPEQKKKIYHPHTPNRSLSPKVKVVLDQSPGGSKIRVRSPGRSNKRSADRDLNVEKRKQRRKLSPSPERARAISPEKRNVRDPAERKTGLAGRKPVRDRLGTRDDKCESLEKDKITELKPIPSDTPQSACKKSSGKGKDVSGNKSLSGLRNQGKDNSREKEIDKKQENSRHNNAKSAAGKLSAAVDLTADSDDDDDDRRGRANHRLVSERTFASGWERKKPSLVPKLSPAEKPGTTSESYLLPKDTEEKVDEVDTNITDTEDKKPAEESNEFDFLNDTLDDDNESTVIDEYEEILDYQDLDGTTELLVQESASSHINTDVEGVKKSTSKESIGSPVIDLCIDPEERAIEASTSAESNLESIQCSNFEDNELVKIPSEESDSSRGGTVVAQGQRDAVLEGGEVGDEDIDGIELHDSEDLEVVGDSVSASDKVSQPQSLADNNSLGAKEMKEPDICRVEICGNEGSREADDVPLVTCDAPEGRPDTEDDKKSNAADETTTVTEAEPNKTVVSKLAEDALDELGPDILKNIEEWNVVDSFDDQEELTQETVPSRVNESRGKKQENMTELDLVERDDPSSKSQDLELQKMKGDGSVTQNAAATESKYGGKTSELDTQLEINELSPQISTGDVKNDEHDSQVSKGVSYNDKPGVQVSIGSGRSDKPHPQGSNDIDSGKGKNSQTETEEPLLQVRSVSDIEKFLLLSSQEAEAKREQGIDSTFGKNDRKSGVFSRLGEKLPTDKAGSESPTVVLELPSETSVSAPGPSSKVSSSPARPPQPATKATAAANKSKMGDPEDPVGMLFSDKPCPQILIGPMNFIEPLPNFQQFTQRYMMRLLEQEKVSFKKIYVCHEDVTGAPYHYVLIIFHSSQEASDWFKKRKGRFKADEKLFKKVAGHLKHRFIPSGETFLHFTQCSWFCKVCKKMNFPPRSLCFNCFHHKDPKGFSPLTILDKGPPPYKKTNFVGAPKLKFFVTKEKVIESAPPLDGFDIKSIEMIMDEKMGFPAGICVFELPDHISAGKLKKYLNHRDVEAVSVQMHEKPKSVSTGPPIAPFRKIPQKVSGSDTPRRPSEEKEHLESGGIQERLPRFPTQDVQGPRDLLPTAARDVRVLRGHSPSPVRDIRVPKVGLPTPSWDVRIPRGRSPGPIKAVRVPRGRLPTPPRDARVPRHHTPSPSLGVRIPRDRLLSPTRDSRFPRGRSPSPLRQRHSGERVLSRSPRRHSPGYQPRIRSPPRRDVYEDKRYTSPENRSLRDIHSRGRPIRESSPRHDTKGEPRRLRSRERFPSYHSPVPYRSPGYQSPPRYRSRSPVYDPPRRRSPSPRYRSPPSVRPIKPDGRGDWRYPPPDPTNFRFEPKSGLDYDSTTTLYYEPKSCCFYNDDTNEWLEYSPRTGRYTLVR